MTDFVKYMISRWAYSVGSPILSDAEYAILDRAMKRQYPNNPYCQRSWSSDPCPVALLKEYGYQDLIKAVVLSDKTESIPSLNSPVEVRLTYEAMHTPHSVSLKHDGWNIQASYYSHDLVNIQTRGRSSDAMDASSLTALLPKHIPEPGRVLVVMECTVPDAEFPWFKERFGVASQRGAVSTALANPKSCLDHIAIHAHGVRCSSVVADKFSLLKSWGFHVPMYAWVNHYLELMDQVKAFSAYKDQYGIPTDGLVVEGEATNALRIEAWEEPIFQSYVTGYKETYGPHSIAIQCSIYPIKLRNSVQQQLPATNLSRIINLNLRPGYPVAFRIASSAIADIDEDSTRLLQKEWKNREDTYRYRIQMNEALKDERYCAHI